MPGTKRPNRKPKKKRSSNEAENPGGQPKHGIATGAKSFGAPKGGRSFTSPTSTRGASRGG